MTYSQKPLIELLKAGKFPGETGRPKHIETVISNVFIFDKKVYKVYKNDNEFFNKGFRDISDKLARFNFTRRDFDWNNTLSPSIYLKLMGVSVEDGSIKELPTNDDAEELIFVMKKIDASDVLFEKLMNNQISKEDSYSMGKQMALNLKKVQTVLPERHNYFESFVENIASLRDWIKSVTEYVSKEEADSYLDFMDDFRKKNRSWFENELSNEITWDGDVHSHNAVYSKGSFYLMDTFPPKEAWHIGHKFWSVYRIAVDVWVLTGKKELFDDFLKGYEEGSGNIIDRKIEPLYVIYASAIMVSYLYMLQRTDSSKMLAAKKFHQFIREYFKSIK